MEWNWFQESLPDSLILISILFWSGIPLRIFERRSPKILGLRGTQAQDVGFDNVATSPPGVVVLGVLGIVLRLSGILAWYLFSCLMETGRRNSRYLTCAWHRRRQS